MNKIKIKIHELWRLYRKDVYKVLVIFLFMSLAVGLNVWYTNYVDRNARNTWCDLLVALDKRNETVDAPTPDQVEFFRYISDLVDRQGCR